MTENSTGAMDQKEDSPSPLKESLKNRLLGVFKEIIAVLFWIYVVIKLFVFDIDLFVLRKISPNHLWVLDYKFPILIGSLALVWLVTQNRRMLLGILYVLCYPFIIIFASAYLLFRKKSWSLAFVVANVVISFFRSIKYHFLMGALFLVLTVLVLNVSNVQILWISISLMFAALLVVYVHRFISVFQPSGVLRLYIKLFSGIRKHGNAAFILDDSIRDIPVPDLDQKQLEKWTGVLQAAVLFNRLCLFTAKKLGDYQKSRLHIIPEIFTILFLIAFTIFCFAVINFGVYKIDSNNFAFENTPAFFTFFYYSFNNLFFNSISEIAPAMFVAQLLSMLESGFAFLLGVIFISLMLPVRDQKHEDELKSVIAGIKQHGVEMENFIQLEYKLNTIADALVELEKLKVGSAKFLIQMTDSIDESQTDH